MYIRADFLCLSDNMHNFPQKRKKNKEKLIIDRPGFALVCYIYIGSLIKTKICTLIRATSCSNSTLKPAVVYLRRSHCSDYSNERQPAAGPGPEIRKGIKIKKRPTVGR